MLGLAIDDEAVDTRLGSLTIVWDSGVSECRESGSSSLPSTREKVA